MTAWVVYVSDANIDRLIFKIDSPQTLLTVAHAFKVKIFEIFLTDIIKQANDDTGSFFLQSGSTEDYPWGKKTHNMHNRTESWK